MKKQVILSGDLFLDENSPRLIGCGASSIPVHQHRRISIGTISTSASASAQSAPAHQLCKRHIQRTAKKLLHTPERRKVFNTFCFVAFRFSFSPPGSRVCNQLTRKFAKHIKVPESKPASLSTI